MRRAALMAVLLAATLGGACNSNDDTFFDAILSPDNEVPPRASGASGTARLTFDGTTVTYVILVSNMTNITAAHIHSAAAGVNGPVRVGFFAGPTTSISQGTLVEGSFTASDVTGIDFNTLLGEMRAGTAYVNVHSTTYPGGEIRGQTRLLN